MFYQCYDIIEINMYNFDASKCTSMTSMFSACKALTSLNLSNFITSSAESMNWMFRNCLSLTSLNLSNFDATRVTNMAEMFENSTNLEYINMKNFNRNNLNSIYNILKNIPNNIVICINEDNNENKILPQIKNIPCHSIHCSDDWKFKQKKIIQETGECVDNCAQNEKYKYEYNGKCIENCKNGFLTDTKNSITNICKCELEKCLTCSQEALNKNLCSKCNDDYYKMENDPSNIGEYFNCYKEFEGYYLDKNNSLFKKCYDTCETCEIKGNNISHNCIKCNKKYSFELIIGEYINCYENCSFYYYFDNENYFHCTSSLSCPKEYPILLADKNECIKDDKIKIETTEIILGEYTTSKYITSELLLEHITTIITESEQNAINIDNIYNKIEDILIKYKKNETERRKTKEEEANYYNEIISRVESIFTDKNFDTTNLDNGMEQVIKTEKMSITLTTTQNQKNKTNDNNNMTIIDLGDCEKDLKEFYNISNDEILYMKKVDVLQEGMKIPKIE